VKYDSANVSKFTLVTMDTACQLYETRSNCDDNNDL